MDRIILSLKTLKNKNNGAQLVNQYFARYKHNIIWSPMNKPYSLKVKNGQYKIIKRCCRKFWKLGTWTGYEWWKIYASINQKINYPFLLSLSISFKYFRIIICYSSLHTKWKSNLETTISGVVFLPLFLDHNVSPIINCICKNL